MVLPFYKQTQTQKCLAFEWKAMLRMNEWVNTPKLPQTLSQQHIIHNHKDGNLTFSTPLQKRLQHNPSTLTTMSKIIAPLGILILIHSAYSCLHYRSILTSSIGVTIDEDFLLEKGYNPQASKPPLDVVVEVCIGFVLCLFGQMKAVGKFLPVVGSGMVPLRAPAHISRDFDLVSKTRAHVVAKARLERKKLWRNGE